MSPGAVVPVLVGLAGLASALALHRASGSTVVSRVLPAPSEPLAPRRTWRERTERLPRSRPLWSVGGGLLGWVIAGPPAGIVLGLGASFAPRILERRSASRQAAALDERLADGVRAISAGLRAGLSIPQAIRIAAGEAEPPLSVSLSRLVRDVDVGEPLDDALRRWATSVGTDDARLVVGVLGLHRRSGGDLPRVLDQVATTLRERHAAVREVRALTAQARLSGAILGLLPIGFFAFLWLISRRDIEEAFRTPAGLASLALGCLLEAIAFVWIRRLLEVR